MKSYQKTISPINKITEGRTSKLKIFICNCLYAQYWQILKKFHGFLFFKETFWWTYNQGIEDYI